MIDRFSKWLLVIAIYLLIGGVIWVGIQVNMLVAYQYCLKEYPQPKLCDEIVQEEFR